MSLMQEITAMLSLKLGIFAKSSDLIWTIFLKLSILVFLIILYKSKTSGNYNYNYNVIMQGINFNQRPTS